MGVPELTDLQEKSLIFLLSSTMSGIKEQQKKQV